MDHKIKIKTIIILINYNGYEDTLECLKSLKIVKQPLPLVVIVDNASKNARKLDSLRDIYIPLHIIYNDENVGFGRANNIGINWAKQNLVFEYICLLNNDTIVTPDFLDHLITPFRKDPEIGITSGKIFYESNRKLIWYGGAYMDFKRGWPKISDYNLAPTLNGAMKSKYVDFVSGCLIMFNYKAINILKGFDEKIFMYCEDLELSLRATDLGIRMYYNADAIIFHKVNASLKNDTKIFGLHGKNSNVDFLFYHLKKNQFTTINGFLKGKDSWIFSIHYWCIFIYKVVFISLTGNPRIFKTAIATICDIYKERNK